MKSIAAIIVFVVGLFYWFIEGAISAPIETNIVNTANATAAYGYWWFALTLSIIFVVGGIVTLAVFVLNFLEKF